MNSEKMVFDARVIPTFVWGATFLVVLVKAIQEPVMFKHPGAALFMLVMIHAIKTFEMMTWGYSMGEAIYNSTWFLIPVMVVSAVLFRIVKDGVGLVAVLWFEMFVLLAMAYINTSRCCYARGPVRRS